MSLTVELRRKEVEASAGFGCGECSFALWSPVAPLTVSAVGLYDDGRFPGRLIVSLFDHFDHFEDLSADLLQVFMSDIQSAARILRQVVDAERVNIAILGNQESHVHAHLIPRLREGEPLPHKSPWQDPRPAHHLGRKQRSGLMRALKDAFGASGSGVTGLHGKACATPR